MNNNIINKSIMNKFIYNTINLARTKNTVNILNKITNTDDHNLITPKLYLGNINSSMNTKFFRECKIEAIVNCTENEPFHEYFENRAKFRLNVNDSREPENIEKFKKEILKAIDFIDNCIEQEQVVYVHCYYGLMRSATLVACYIIKKYGLTKEAAISFVKEQRPYSLTSIYNFDEILDFITSDNQSE